MRHTDSELLNSARELMRTEAGEILSASERLSPEIVNAARLICQCEGRVSYGVLRDCSCRLWRVRPRALVVNAGGAEYPQLRIYSTLHKGECI
ncbi:MAG: hypothetical protein IJS28_03050 [Synergistaceae bacterium]|nr:hypothetical protein [Synergistaceae bacterium]